jgi:uncharacterized protein
MINIFNQRLFLGYISKINAGRTFVHVPSSTYLNKFFHYGEIYHGGVLNSYVVIEGEQLGFIGRITSAEIPEKERLELSTESMKYNDFHPLLQLEILSEFDYSRMKFQKSIVNYPNIGAKVHIASNLLVKKYLSHIENKNHLLKTNSFAKILSPNYEIDIDFSLQNLFARHAAIIGTTGSGKSWTTSSLVINLINENQKVILIDATGEYKSLADIYCTNEKIILGETHILSYKHLKIQDLFNLLSPAPNAQAPKLKEAIRSLKLINTDNPDLSEYISQDGLTIIKEGKDRQSLIEIFNKEAEKLSTDNCNFDIRGLADQIQNECIWPSDRNGNFGGPDNNALGHCTSLITRIESLIKDEFYNSIFDFQLERKSIPDVIDILNSFLNDNKEGTNLLYIDVSQVPFTFQMRELVVDIIGQNLLNSARMNAFRENPLTVFIDEAHQFLNKKVTNDFESRRLEAFESIAKEGRKYGLFLCITTQLPRDIPTGILSQIGTFITHRLINQRDKEIILHSLPTMSNEIINYLPTLSKGEAIISSSELEDSLYIRINPPFVKPNSNTPEYSQDKNKSNQEISSHQQKDVELIHDS